MAKEVKLYQSAGNLYKDKELTHMISADLGYNDYDSADSTSNVTLQLIKQGVSVDDIIKLKNQELL